MKFVGREEELSHFEDRYRSGKAEFLIVYGRRRVGKTSFLLKFAENKKSIYLLARETTTEENLRRFSEVVSTSLNDSFLKLNPFVSWDALFSYFSSAKERLLLIIDEYPYLTADRSLASTLQEHWDRSLSKTALFLVLCGSSVSAMSKLMSRESPLYLRRTGQLEIRPFPFREATLFFPNYKNVDKAIAYAILGGMPSYLSQFDEKLSIRENLIRAVRRDSILYNDAEYILKEDFREVRNYFSLLEAISMGRSKPQDIMSYTGQDKGTFSKYVHVLTQLHIVRRVAPYDSRRKFIYTIADNYIRFWFRYIQRNKEMAEAGRTKELVDLILMDLPNYMGKAFEGMVSEYMTSNICQNPQPWWHKGVEIDIVCKSGNVTILAEVKWSVLSEGEVMKSIGELDAKSGFVKGRKKLLIFCRSSRSKAAITLDDMLSFS
ncbi:MAG: ATP-binding protein [Thermoplasmata archaeon]|nr:ATP-binding protein [Candidatus Sysuiplasma acidicola]MBX8646865.1 ATP-binding protein [Candidatus Sysuiplasma acidicola]